MASIHYRTGNTWTKTEIIYEKVNGEWIRKTSIGSVLEDDTVYIPLTALGLLIDEGLDHLLIGDDRILI